MPQAERPAAVIVNVQSGSVRRTALRKLPALFASSGVDATIIIARRGADVRRQAQAAARHFPVLIAAGGDGTVSAVAAQVACSESILGILPLGTLNHFARDLGIPMDLPAAVQSLGAGVVRSVDIGEVNGYTFVNNSSLGLYPRLVQERESHRAVGYGRWFALGAAVLSTFRRFGFVHVRVVAPDYQYDGATPFVFVGNNRYALTGLALGSRETVSAGELCVCLAHRVGRWGLLRMATGAVLGRLPRSPGFDLLATQEVVVEPRTRRMRVSLDGEIVRMETPLHYRVLPGALRVIVPA